MGFLPLKNFVPAEILGDSTARAPASETAGASAPTSAAPIICGIDEVGRGPWAGPVVGCALTLLKDVPIPGCADSKMLTAAEREKVFARLQKVAIFGVGIVQPSEIDSLGLLKATNLSFVRALQELVEKLNTTVPGHTGTAPGGDRPVSKHHTTSHREPAFLLVDGRDRLSLPYPFKTIIKGDQKIKLIAAASIVAKVVRDNLMENLAKKYPQYGFADHKGYGTAQHQKALRQHGLCKEHRKSFKPVHALFQAEMF